MQKTSLICIKRCCKSLRLAIVVWRGGWVIKGVGSSETRCGVESKLLSSRQGRDATWKRGARRLFHLGIMVFHWNTNRPIIGDMWRNIFARMRYVLGKCVRRMTIIELNKDAAAGR